MTVSGLTGNPCCLRIPLHDPKTLSRRFSVFLNAEKPKDSAKLLGVKRCNIKETYLVKCAMDASYGGDMTNDRPVIFPRIHVRDPYKRLGISREASEDEIQAARRFLVNQYSGHKPSVDAIESAHDKIIMQKFYDRKNPKIDFKKKVREMKQSRFMQFVTSRFQTPSTMLLLKQQLLFYNHVMDHNFTAVLQGWIFYFRMAVGNLLDGIVIPPLPLVKGPRSFEVITSLITYALLWVSSTYLK
ncbi:protein CHAPERONE PROTEIN OF POR [Salix suchowensis]|nr:protein CHAPERONE PROTEIN OF POR [Salix suchowensis]